MRPLGTILLAAFSCLALCGFPRTAAAQTDEAIEEARLRGVEFIKSQQGPDGSWLYPSHAVGITALCGLALLENGVPVSDPVVEDAHDFVRSNYQQVRNTYDLTLAILFLSRVGDRESRTPIRTMAARLIAGQNVEGGWSYTNPQVGAGVLANPSELPDRPDGVGDNSCTQFGTLGLWVASRWGVGIDDAMSRVGERFETQQLEDGGWTYRYDLDAEEQAPSRNSMTFAGLFCLAVARATEIRSEQERVRTRTGEPVRTGFEEDATTLLEDPVFIEGLERANQYARGINRNAARYFLWSVERLGVLLGLEEFGEVDWFDQGAVALLATQQEDGSWRHPNEDRGSLSDTSFAILFLRRANLGSDISRLLAGEPEEKFQIVTQEGGPRFSRLDRAIEAAEPGDVIRVDGNGPFDMPQYNFDKDLTIEAGHGYTPVFRYEVGYDERRRRRRPEEDEDARFMIRVNAGELTLEGLELHMDPPDLRRSISWAAIVLNGGNLRMLNCMVSESNDQDMAAVSMPQPGSLEARNCVFVGGRAAVEVLTTGKQQVRLENSVVHSRRGFNVFNGAESDSKQLDLHLERCVLHCPDVFWFPLLESPVSITSIGCAYKAEWLGSRMLPAADSHDNLTWRGEHNIYDVGRWVGADGTPSPEVSDERSWNAFWGGTDESASKRLIPFAGRRPFGAFSHSIRADDFEFDPNSGVYAYRRRSGIDPLIVGPGSGFSRFRESFDYRTWESAGEEELAATE